MPKPNNPDRNPDGRFAKGNRLAGNKTGSRHKITRAIEALLEGQHEALTKVAIDKALQGDTAALKLCLDRIAPPRKDAPISVALPPVRTVRETLDASAIVLSSVAVGEITPDEAGRIMALLMAHKAIVEASDHEVRIAELEQQLERRKQGS
jgi:hypothetical protein